jgi:hypothetical protein
MVTHTSNSSRLRDQGRRIVKFVQSQQAIWQDTISKKKKSSSLQKMPGKLDNDMHNKGIRSSIS